MEGKYGIAGWQWLFIVLAICGAGFAVLAAFLLPDYPDSKTGSASWTMTEDMRRIAAARIIADRVTVASLEEVRPGIWQGLWLSLKDYRLGLIILLNITISAAYGFSNFFPAIVRGFGYDRTTTLVMTFPPYLGAAITAVLLAWSSDRFVDRGWHLSAPIGVAMIAYIVCMITQNHIARYAVSFLFVGGLFGANPLINTWITSTFARIPEKKATSIAINNILGQIGNVMAPYFFVASDEPRYWMAFILMFVMSGLCVCVAMILKFSLYRENKKILAHALQHRTPYNPYIT